MFRVPDTIRDYVQQQIGRLVRYRRQTLVGASGADEVTGWPSGPGEPEGGDQVRRLQHYGFRSAPPAGSELLTVAVGGAAGQHVAIASDTPGAGPTDQAEGDVTVYCQDGATCRIVANGASILIDANGKITVDAAPGQDIVLNGGTANLARTLVDPVDLGYLVVTPGAGGVGAVAWLPPGTTPLPGPPAVVTPLVGKITGGAAHALG